MLLTIIIACEIGFWVFVLAGLIARYPLRRPRLGAVLLAMSPLVDLVLLTATVIDLRNGATPHVFHALAAIYIGVSIGFGHSMIRWADARFARRFDGGPKPAPGKPAGKPAPGHARNVWAIKGWLRHLLAWSVGASLLFLAQKLTGGARAEEVFGGAIRAWALILGIDAIWTISYFFDREKESSEASRPTMTHDERQPVLKCAEPN